MFDKLKFILRIPYWVALILGTLGTFFGMNAYTTALQNGAFNEWSTIKSPPSGAIKIIGADYREIWVETKDGQIFQTCLFGAESDNCLEWKSVEDPLEFRSWPFMITGKDCNSLQDNPPRSNPRGQYIECVYAYFPGPEMGEEAYYALMTDGSIKYWTNGGSDIERMIFFAFSIISSILVAVFISIFYLIMNMITRDERKGKITQ